MNWLARRKIIKCIRAYLAAAPLSRAARALKHARGSKRYRRLGLAASRRVAIIARQVFLPVLFPTLRMWSSAHRARYICAQTETRARVFPSSTSFSFSSTSCRVPTLFPTRQRGAAIARPTVLPGFSSSGVYREAINKIYADTPYPGARSGPNRRARRSLLLGPGYYAGSKRNNIANSIRASAAALASPPSQDLCK